MTYPLTAIISDLHGNVPALEVALEHARSRGVRRYVCLGDMVGYGADPCATLEVAMRLCVPGAKDIDGSDLEDGHCLKGNHEEALLFSAEDFNPKARAAIEWTREELSRNPDRADAYWDFIGELEASGSDDVAEFAHGSPRDPVREYMLPRDARDTVKMAANFAAMHKPLCFVGHSHVPAIYREDGGVHLPKGNEGPLSVGASLERKAIVNVGSVGQPRDGDPNLSYVLFDGERVEFVRLDYEQELAADAIRAVPELPDFLADRLIVGR